MNDSDNYQKYIGLLDELREHRRVSTDVIAERPILARIEDAWDLLTDAEQEVARKNTWVADPEIYDAVNAALDKALAILKD
jgi:hypothetical protein